LKVEVKIVISGKEVFGSLMATLLLAVLEMVLVIINITMTP